VKRVLLSIFGIFILMQFITIDRKNPPFDKSKEIDIKGKAKEILKRACYDCHSYETVWPSYSLVAPLSWGIGSHVKDGRKAINFSVYKDMEEWKKRDRLKRAIQLTNNGLMPLKSYLLFHKEAKLTKSEKEVLSEAFQKELDRLNSKKR
jgi:hypothetical protein